MSERRLRFVSLGRSERVGAAAAAVHGFRQKRICRIGRFGIDAAVAGVQARVHEPVAGPPFHRPVRRELLFLLRAHLPSV